MLVVTPLVRRLHRVRLHPNKRHVHRRAYGHRYRARPHSANRLHPERNLGSLIELRWEFFVMMNRCDIVTETCLAMKIRQCPTMSFRRRDLLDEMAIDFLFHSLTPDTRWW